jgi:hypothetical protein
MHEMNKIIVDRSRPRLRGTVFGQASIGQIFVKLFERHNTSSIDVRFDDKTSLNFAIEPRLHPGSTTCRLEDRQLASHQEVVIDPQPVSQSVIAGRYS